MANIVDKYFNKKKKEIIEYAKIVNNLLEYDKDTIWGDIDFNETLKKVVGSYVDSYYFEPMTDFTEYSEYLGALIKCDDKFKTVLVCSVKAIEDKEKKNNYKITTYIMSLIVYTSIALNRFTYPYNNYKINITNVFSIIEKIFKNIDFITYKENTKLRKELVALVKKNDNNESKFFETLDSLNTEVSKNVYETVDSDSHYFTVKYKYNIPEFKNYRNRDVQKYFKRIKDNLNVLSYELACLTILKAKMLNKNITLLFPVSLEFYRKESEINRLSNVIDNENIKNSIKLYVEYEDYNNNRQMVRILMNASFQLALNIEDAEDVPYRTFNEIKLATVTREFLDKNKGNLESWNENDVVFVVKSDIKNEMSEKKILGLEEK